MKKDLIFITFPDCEDEDSIIYFEVPDEDPDESTFLSVSKIYRKAEENAKKMDKPVLIYQYEIVDGRFINGTFKKRIANV